MGLDQHVAQGTSLLVIIPAAAFGSFTHHRHGRLALRDAAALAVGGVLGAALGSVTALSLDEKVLQRLFAVLILVVAARLLTTRRSAPEPIDPATT
jgi:uncharacterized membrane protein YfcA